MLDKLKDIKKKSDVLKEKLVSPKVLSDHNLITKYSRELKELDPVVVKYDELMFFENEKKEAIEMLEVETDSDMTEMFKEAISECEGKITLINEELKILLLPKDPNDGKNAILEIRGAAGGDEANIFAGDLYRMYTKYFESIGWKTEILESNVAENGGFSLISFLIKGDSVFSKLKFESGSHRVQRVPQTESQGRIHTSTATVVVMPEISAVEINIKDSDIKVDVYRSSGAGGQSVNTTDSAVRITHIPTSIVVTSQDQRSQIQNREKAMQVLASKIYDHELTQQMQANDSERKLKLGSGARSEKIRTYNYPQNRLTDHRINLTLNKLDQVMEGKISEIIDALVVEHQLEQMKVKNE